MSEAERREANMWSEILEEWLSIRSQYTNKAKSRFYVCRQMSAGTSELHISRGTLYRKLRAWKKNDIYGLVDKRGGWNKKSSSIPPMVWEAFLWYWLDENRPTVSLCYRKTVNWTEQFYPELVDLIPTERSFRRHIENDVKYAVKSTDERR